MSFLGERKEELQIDTGLSADAALKPRLFQRAVGELGAHSEAASWKEKNPAGVTSHQVVLLGAVLHGEACTNVELIDFPESAGDNILGLRFLARHLTTLNFPQRTMYLQHENKELFAHDNPVTNAPGYVLTMESVNFVTALKEQGQLPGYSKHDKGNITAVLPAAGTFEKYPVSLAFVATKKNDASKYHYLVVKASRNNAWQLQRAWRTDANKHVVEEYIVGRN